MKSIFVLSPVVVVCSLLHSPDLRAASDYRPNIVLIVADDMGFSDLGCYGGEIDTPNHLTNWRATVCGLLSSTTTPFATPRGLLYWPVSIPSKSVTSNYPIAYHRRGTLHCRAPDADVREMATGRPTDRGFDRYFGLLTGTCNHFNPGNRRFDEPASGKKYAGDNPPFALDDEVFKPYTPPHNFYSTDVFTDYALQFLGHTADDHPFFLYVAYTVPHYPLHAWPEDIAKYRGKYLAGWDQLRKDRHERLVQQGIISSRWPLSGRSPHAPAWKDIIDKDAWDLKIAVYAAMVVRMDQNIGRIMSQLRKMGAEDNTLVLFLSDNGPGDEDRTRTPDISPGPVESYCSVDLPWANLSNMPFRQFKRWNHEGGISTPLIAYWSRGIQRPGEITEAVGHVIDILPTCLNVAGAGYPAPKHKERWPSPEGCSLFPAFASGEMSQETVASQANDRAKPRSLF